MRIAIVLPSLGPVGGVEAVRIELARHFIRNGHHVDFVLGWEEGERPSAVPTEARVIVFGVRSLRRMVTPLAWYLRKERPDAVLSAMWPLNSLVGVAHWLAGSKAQFVMSDHNTLTRQYRKKSRLALKVMAWSIRLTYPRADWRIAVSSGVANDISDLSGCDRDSFEVVHNPLWMKFEAVARSVSDAVWDGYAGPRILTVGRLKTQKNHRLLIEAFSALRANRKARLVILGTGECEDDTRKAIRDAGMESDILLPGFAEDPSPYYQGADLFVLSSDYEGFGNVIVEALAQGVPVVSTDCPSGPSEILEDGRYGRLVPVGDAEGLRAAMEASLDATHDHDALRARGLSFSMEATGDKYLELLTGGGKRSVQKPAPRLGEVE